MDTDKITELQTLLAAKRRAAGVANTAPQRLSESIQKILPSHSSASASQAYWESLETRVPQQQEFNRRERVLSLVRAARLPKRHNTKSLDCPDAGPQADVLARIDAELGTGSILVLLGPRGTGKTQLATWAIRAVCEREKSALFTEAAEMFRTLRGAFRPGGEDESVILRRYRKPSLLVIDEVQERGETPYEDRMLVGIINDRYKDLTDTILIGNDKPDNFAMSIGSSALSRIIETGKIIECNWPSFRTGGGK